MKKHFLMIAAVCCAMGANAQIKVKNNGYVGIGSLDPQYKFDVHMGGQTIRFRDWLILNRDYAMRLVFTQREIGTYNWEQMKERSEQFMFKPFT